MPINKLHPSYEEYIGKCRKLAAEEDEEMAKLVPGKYRGFDNPEELEIHKKFSRKLKELQKEYSFLFE